MSEAEAQARLGRDQEQTAHAGATRQRHQLVAAVGAGCGVALVPQALTCSAGARLKLLPLSPHAPPLVFGAAWRHDGLTVAAEQFLRSSKEAAAKS